MVKKIKVKLKPYNALKDNFTQVANTMFDYIDDHYCFRVYFYLCRRYNPNYDYAFPSYATLAKDCKMSLRKAKSCIKWLSDNGYIVKGKYGSDGYSNNIYYIRYLEVDKSQIEEAITIEKEIIFEEDCEILIEER